MEWVLKNINTSQGNIDDMQVEFIPDMSIKDNFYPTSHPRQISW